MYSKQMNHALLTKLFNSKHFENATNSTSIIAFIIARGEHMIYSIRIRVNIYHIIK